MHKPQTIVEKIMSQHSAQNVYAGDITTADVDLMFFHDGNRPLAIEVLEEFNVNKLCDPSRIIGIMDHAPSSPTESVAKMHHKIREFVRQHTTRLYECGEGSCHQLISEQGHVVPGSLVIGSDSHSCTHGAMNAFATGVGVSDLASAMVMGKLWFLVPETIKIKLTGKLSKGVYAKDIVLYLAGKIGANGANYKALEFCGNAIEDLSVDSRMTICNMAIEMGAKCALMPYDTKLEQWLSTRTTKKGQPCFADAGANYLQVLNVDVSTIGPQVAKPHKVDNVAPVSEVIDIPVREAIIGTCTNGRLEDLKVAARILEGKKIAQGLTLIVAPASRSVYIEAVKEGLIEIFLKAGANIAMPGCSACSAGAYVGVPFDGENVITTANRNFKGRLGNPKANIYLASPATVAASALTGKITDCRNFVR